MAASNLVVLSNELERMWKVMVVTNFKVRLEISENQPGAEEKTQITCQVNLLPGQDVKWVPPMHIQVRRGTAAVNLLDVCFTTRMYLY